MGELLVFYFGFQGNVVLLFPILKIGLIRRGYSSTGGAERYLLRFAEGLEKAGHTLVLFTDRQWPAEEWQGKGREIIVVGEDAESLVKSPSNKAQAIWLKLVEFYRKEKTRARRNPLRFADDLEALKPREHCDFLFSMERVWDCDCYRAGDGVHKAWLRRRAVFEKPWPVFFRRFSPKHQQMLQLEQAIFAPLARPHIIANSKMVAQEISDYYHTEKNRISVIPNGYDMPKGFSFSETIRTEERRKLGVGPDETTFLFVGSGWKRKGLSYAAYAARRIHQLEGKKTRIKLLVAGKDRRSVPQMNDRDPVTYLGPLSGAELRKVYQAADVFVLPTIYDPFSNATLEAAAHGLPVITTSANGFSEHMPPFLGSVIDDPSEGSLLTAFREWMANDKGRQEARDANAKHAKSFDVATNVSRSLEVFLELLDSPDFDDSVG